MTTVPIDRRVPVPEFGSKKKYPWKEMQVGDSFLFPTSKQYAYEAARSATKRYSPKVFKVKQMKDGFRCWRVV